MPRYPSSLSVGVVITARCDIAQNKYPILNFVPAVPLSDWFRKDGLSLLVDSERKTTLAKVTNILKEARVSEALLTAVSLAEIAEKHFPKNQPAQTSKKLVSRFEQAAAEMSDFNELLQTDDSNKIFDWFATERAKNVKKMIDRLSKHDVSGYYFLEHLDNDGDQIPFVCLLRDVTAISRNLSEKIAGGLSRQALEIHPNKVEKGHLNISSEDLAMPVSCIGSPTIEHLMQTFSSLFGRIGLEDPDTDLLEKIAVGLSSKNGR